jgi:hypothetical protein
MDQIRTKPASIDTLVERLTDAWFNDNFRDWLPKHRFACAFAGSATFVATFVVNIALTLPATIIADDAIRLSVFLAIVFFFIASGWFALLVSWRNTRSGPTRLYLSGLLL